jgi:hypothetical protein
MTGVVSNVAVEQVSQKDVTTRFGSKPTFSFKAGGEWFKTGFGRHGLNVGDVVSFSYTEGKYGKEVDAKAIAKGASSIATGAGTTATPGAVAGAAGSVASKPYSSGSKGVFPIPALDGQRAIVRQNSLTNAVKFAEFHPCDGDTTDERVNEIIRVARKFEAYSCGDLDQEEVEAEMAAEEGTPKKKSKKAA